MHLIPLAIPDHDGCPGDEFEFDAKRRGDPGHELDRRVRSATLDRANVRARYPGGPRDGGLRNVEMRPR